MSDMIKITALNLTGGPKILNSIPARVLQAGEYTGERVEISGAELTSMRATGYFKFGDDDGDEAPKPVALSGKNKAELLEIADAEKVPDVTAEMTNADITSAIELHREANS